MSTTADHITVVGGGPAGLSAAYHARKSGHEVRVLEAAAEVGGNCRTLRLGRHRFDTGAHRFHDRIPHVTAEIRGLLGGDLRRVDAPSQIYTGGKFIDFPPSPLNLIRALDLRTLSRAVLELARRSQRRDESFGSLAEARYGATLARLFLLNYSEKLWGERADRLSTAVAGERLKGLDIRTLFIETLRGRRGKTRHLDGSFYYPRHGYGQIVEALAETIGRARIRTGARITRIVHDGGRITDVEVNREERLPVGAVVNTLPLPLSIRLLDPAPPDEILALADSLRFRHLRLAVFALRRERVSANASIYFPDRSLPFTRLYEPKNRSSDLSPLDETLIVVETPCSGQDDVWHMDDPAFLRTVVDGLASAGLVHASDLGVKLSLRMPAAYPVLELGYDERAARLAAYLQSFENMYLVGRNARFAYAHLHDLFDDARRTIASIRPCPLPMNRSAIAV